LLKINLQSYLRFSETSRGGQKKKWK